MQDLFSSHLSTCIVFSYTHTPTQSAALCSTESIVLCAVKGAATSRKCLFLDHIHGRQIQMAWPFPYGVFINVIGVTMTHIQVYTHIKHARKHPHANMPADEARSYLYQHRTVAAVWFIVCIFMWNKNTECSFFSRSRCAEREQCWCMSVLVVSRKQQWTVLHVSQRPQLRWLLQSGRRLQAARCHV